MYLRRYSFNFSVLQVPRSPIKIYNLHQSLKVRLRGGFVKCGYSDVNLHDAYLNKKSQATLQCVAPIVTQTDLAIHFLVPSLKSLNTPIDHVLNTLYFFLY